MADEGELLEAVAQDRGDAVRALLDRNPFLLRMPTPNGTLILTAKYYGAQAALTVLLDKTREDELNLYEAAAVGHARRLKTILGQSRTRVNAPNPEGFTPLGLAAFFGHPEAVHILLEHGAAVNESDKSRFANTALDAAVAADHIEVVRVLLAAGANVNVRSAGAATPLHKAAMNGNAEIAALLLDRGADMNATRANGHTPLTDAEEKGHAAVVELFKARRVTAKS